MHTLIYIKGPWNHFILQNIVLSVHLDIVLIVFLLHFYYLDFVNEALLFKNGMWWTEDMLD